MIPVVNYSHLRDHAVALLSARENRVVDIRNYGDGRPRKDFWILWNEHVDEVRNDTITLPLDLNEILDDLNDDPDIPEWFRVILRAYIEVIPEQHRTNISIKYSW